MAGTASLTAPTSVRVEGPEGSEDLAADDPAKVADYETAKAKLDKALPLLSMYGTIGTAEIAERIQAEVDPGVDPKKLGKDLGKADNLWIRIGIMGIALIFILVYLYV